MHETPFTTESGGRVSRQPYPTFYEKALFKAFRAESTAIVPDYDLELIYPSF